MAKGQRVTDGCDIGVVTDADTWTFVVQWDDESRTYWQDQSFQVLPR